MAAAPVKPGGLHTVFSRCEPDPARASIVLSGPPRLLFAMKKKYHSEIVRLRQGLTLLRTYCLKCPWYATGSESAIAIAERAHQCISVDQARAAVSRKTAAR